METFRMSLGFVLDEAVEAAKANSMNVTKSLIFISFAISLQS
jgi:hypothetical protein